MGHKPPRELAMRKCQALVAASARHVCSALVRGFLTELVSGGSDIERLEREERELRACIVGFSAGNRLPRNHVQERGA